MDKSNALKARDFYARCAAIADKAAKELDEIIEAAGEGEINGFEINQVCKRAGRELSAASPSGRFTGAKT